MFFHFYLEAKDIKCLSSQNSAEEVCQTTGNGHNGKEVVVLNVDLSIGLGIAAVEAYCQGDPEERKPNLKY